jgi:hypothetical protein
MSENPPAFPSGALWEGEQRHGGMTLRDWFAGQALAGLLGGQYGHSGDYNLSEVPEEAFRIADAMLAQRERDGVK